MREKGITAGRIDTRFSDNMINRVGESMFYDPMLTVIGPGYLAAFMDYRITSYNVCYTKLLRARLRASR